MLSTTKPSSRSRCGTPSSSFVDVVDVLVTPEVRRPHDSGRRDGNSSTQLRSGGNDPVSIHLTVPYHPGPITSNEVEVDGTEKILFSSEHPNGGSFDSPG